MMTPLLVCWSGGKDSLLMLRRLLGDARYEVAGLLTTVNEGYQRIVMHGVRETLLDIQAAALGLPLLKVYLPQAADNAAYEARMAAALQDARTQGVMHVAFGDIFLADVRAYRENQLARLEMKGVFPLWGDASDALAREFIASGHRAVLTCVDGEQLDGGFAGRDFDQALLDALPAGADPCGENGEFHTFVYAGPLFNAPIRFSPGERVLRDNRFHYIDLVPA